jgi:Bacterial Ig-like domain/WD40-like Beta Propeller Repeat
VLSSCPVELPNRLGWLTSGRFIRLLFAVVGIALLAALLYNAATVDRVAPTFSIHLSSVNSGGLGMTLTSVDVDFSEDVRTDGAQNAFAITPPVSGSFHWQGHTMIFTPDAKLPLSTTFHVHMAAGVEDVAGNAQNNAGDLTFTTVGAPKVTGVVPALGNQAVAVDSPIAITFDRFMDTLKVIAGLSISPAAPFKTSWNGTTLTITPTKPLQFGTDYTVTVSDPAVDTDGSKLQPFTTTFRTVGEGLRVTALIPAPNVAGVSVRTQIAVVFDGSIDPTSVAGVITLTPPVGGTTATLSLPSDAAPTPTPSATGTVIPGGDKVMVFTPDQPLASHTTYTVNMAASVRRTDGQVAPAQSWSFTTGEPPTNALNQIAFLSTRSGVENVWLMNPDGSNQREVTSELVPVSGFDFSGDGSQIAYTAGGIVKRMLVGGGNVSFITSGGNTEYAPMFTPDGTALIVARRNAAGADLGYWRIPLLSGSEVKQLTPDGAPPFGSVAGSASGKAVGAGDPVWAPRAAISADGTTMLVVRGSDNVVELVDLTGVHQPTVLALAGNSRPIWVASSNVFYVSATNDGGATWSCWAITSAGAMSRVVPAVGDLTGSGTGLVYLLTRPDGSTHLAYTSDPASSTPIVLTADPLWSEYSPSFSPDGALIVFGRVGAQNTQLSAGIWVVEVDGSGLMNLSTDGSYPRWLP